MTKGALFWVLMILTLLFGVWTGYAGGWHWGLGMNLLTWVLLGLLGWQVFGAAIK